jgi:hypothetical protein
LTERTGELVRLAPQVASSWTGQVPGGADTNSVKRVGNTFTSESKKGGKLLFTTKTTFSADGKVMTLTTEGTDADGKPMHAVRVYDKQ